MKNALKKIDNLVFNKQFDEALSGLEELIDYVENLDEKYDLQLAHLYYYKASILNLLNRFDEALEASNRSCELDSTNVKHFCLRKAIHECLGNKEAAMHDQIKVFEKMPALIQGREKEFEDTMKYMQELGKNYENGEFTKEEMLDHFINLAKKKQVGEQQMTKFDYKSFAENMSAQAKDMLPADISKEAKSYTIKTIQNFVFLAGEALVNDKSLDLTPEEQSNVCQYIAEWIFHKSIDLAHSEIPQENWDPILQKVAFTIFEIAKQGFSRHLSNDEIRDSIEHHVNKSFKESLEELSKDNKITEEIQEKALKESNIDKMTKESNKPKKENKKIFIIKIIEQIIKIITYPFVFIKHLLAHIIKLYPFRGLIICSIFIIFKLTSKEMAENFTFSTFETLVYAVLILSTLKIIFLTIKDWVNADVQSQLNQLEETKRNMEELVNPDRQFDRLGVDILSLSVGQGLLPIADPDNEDGTLLANVAALRQYLTDTLGYIIPNIRIMDTWNMENFEYAIFVRGNKVANGFVQPKHILVEESVLDNLEDKSIRENAISHLNPLTNEVAYWVDKYTAKDMELNGLEPANVIKEHLKKVVIKNVDKILTTSDVYKYFEQAKKTEHVENIINNLLERLEVEDVRKIFVNLIEEEVSIHDIVYILEKINAYSREEKDVDYISERIRIDLADYISQNNANQGVLHVIKIEDSLDSELKNKLYNDLRGIRFDLEKDEAENLFNNFKKMLSEIREKQGNNLKIVILCSPKIRRALFNFLSVKGLDCVVMSYPEVGSAVELYTIDEIK